MKKFFTLITAVLLSICLFMGLSACGADNTGGGNNSNANANGGGNQSNDQNNFVYYTVTFDSLGGSEVESQTVLAGNPARAPVSPKRDKFDFDGWFDSADGGTLWNFATDRVNGDITLFAHWAEAVTPPEPTATLTFEERGDGYAVTGDSGQAANIVIPAEYNGKPVVAIADRAFAYSRHTSDILSVIIPDSVAEIGLNAFHNQHALVSAEIGEGSKLEKIGNNAFSGNGALESIYLPAGMTTLGEDVFNNCGGLNTIVVAPSNPRYSGEGNCLVDLSTHTLIRGSNQSQIPQTVTKIGVAAFRKSTLTTLTIPVSVTSIDKYAVQDCAIERIIYGGTRAQWEQVVKASHKNWSMGKTDLQITCSDGNA